MAAGAGIPCPSERLKAQPHQHNLPAPQSCSGAQVHFLSASEEINARPHEYNALMLDVARSFSLQRILRCTQIMGRGEKDDLSAAQILYPCMQCADIFYLKARARLPPLRPPPCGDASTSEGATKKANSCR